METTPPIARVLRGGRLESLHRGHVAVVTERGRLRASLGDPALPVYVRSAAKPFQVFPLLEAGGEKAFGLSSAEIALMCASHGGEPRHVQVARRILRRGGFATADLACGAHWPMHEPSARALVCRGERPTALHNNCSGKHAGLLLACRLYGYRTRGYWRREHPIQEAIRDRVARSCGVVASRIPIAIDGCGLPVFELPLEALARGYAWLVAEDDGSEPAEIGRIRRRIVSAMAERPEMVAGADRFTTDFLAAGRGRWVGKEGAEGVYAIGVRARKAGRSLGIAFKIEDGSSRARDAVAVALLDRLSVEPASARRRLSAYRAPLISNFRGDTVGRIVPDRVLDHGR